MFKKKLHKLSQFPSTKRSNTSELKKMLILISHECGKSTQAQDEAKMVIAEFMKQFDNEEKYKPKKEEPKAVKKDIQVKFTQEQLEGLHYTKVDAVAEKFGIGTDGNKAETIQAILSAQGTDSE